MAKLEAYDKALDYSYAPGIFPATECLKNAKKRCMRLLVSSNGLQSEGVQALERDAQEAGVRVEAADRALERISKKENCFAAMVYKKAEGRFDEDSPHIVLHHPSDSGNLGTILRTALGFGLKNIAIIRPAVDSDDPRVVRASMGVLAQCAPLRFLRSIPRAVSAASAFPVHADGRRAARRGRAEGGRAVFARLRQRGQRPAGRLRADGREHAHPAQPSD